MAETNKPEWKNMAMELRELIVMFNFDSDDCANCCMNERMRISLAEKDRQMKELA